MTRDHWPLHARQWSLVGPPLRPAAEDLAAAQGAIDRWWAGRAGAPRALLLGATPELATLAFPAGTVLAGTDRSAPMIRAVWPAQGLPARSGALCADWRALPIAGRGVDLVLGDGSWNVLSSPADEARLLAELARVLAPGGLLVLRAFAAPAEREPLAAVTAALGEGGVRSFHAFKWRLAMALLDADGRVDVAELHEVFCALVPDRGLLSARRGWSLDTLSTIDVYRGSPVRYSFPTLARLRGLLAPAFRELACTTPSYELGERCPTLVLAPRAC